MAAIAFLGTGNMGAGNMGAGMAARLACGRARRHRRAEIVRGA